MPTRPREEDLRRETIALVRDFNRNVVEQHDLCPWAAPVRRERRSWVEACLTSVESAEQLEAALRAPVGRTDPAGVGFGGVLQVAFPLTQHASRDWERLVADTGRRVGNALALAAFHPEYAFRTDLEGAAVRALRRMPCPTVQVIARDALPTGDVQRYLPADEVEQLLESARASDERSRVSTTQRIRAENMRRLQGPSALGIRSVQDELIAAQRALVRAFHG